MNNFLSLDKLSYVNVDHIQMMHVSSDFIGSWIIKIRLTGDNLYIIDKCFDSELDAREYLENLVEVKNKCAG